jgi:hypothetical protein
MLFGMSVLPGGFFVFGRAQQALKSGRPPDIQVRMLGRIHRNMDPVPTSIRARVISARNFVTTAVSGAPSTFVTMVSGVAA